jgi:hypothetical protein
MSEEDFHASAAAVRNEFRPLERLPITWYTYRSLEDDDLIL